MKIEPVKSFKSDRSFLDLSKPSLQALSYTLRHKELWPNSFEWDYSHCESCAIGLAIKLWDEVKIVWDKGDWDQTGSTEIMEIVFSLDTFAAENIFCQAYSVGRSIHIHNVTPEMIADDIDVYLDERLK